jgi:sugar lactone lactonase YvrE
VPSAGYPTSLSDQEFQPENGQTIFSADGASYVYLFHGDGKKLKPYAKLSEGNAFELAVDPSGTLFDPVESDPGSILEYSAGYDKAPKIITDGIVGPQGVAASADGTLYVDNCGHTNCGAPFITVYAPGQTHPSRTISNTLNGPLAVDRKGRLFVCDEGFGFIDYYNKGSSQFQIAAFQQEGPSNIPFGIATDKAGNYYLSLHGDSGSEVLQYAPTGPEGGAVLRKITAGRGSPFSPQGLAVDDRGNLYVADLTAGGADVYAPGKAKPYGFIHYGGLAVAVTHSF